MRTFSKFSWIKVKAALYFINQTKTKFNFMCSLILCTKPLLSPKKHLLQDFTLNEGICWPVVIDNTPEAQPSACKIWLTYHTLNPVKKKSLIVRKNQPILQCFLLCVQKNKITIFECSRCLLSYVPQMVPIKTITEFPVLIFLVLYCQNFFIYQFLKSYILNIPPIKITS